MNISAIAKLYGQEKIKNGKTYMYINKLGVDFTMKNARFKVEDKLNTQNILGKKYFVTFFSSRNLHGNQPNHLTLIWTFVKSLNQDGDLFATTYTYILLITNFYLIWFPGEAINQFLNQNAKELIQEMRPTASQSIARLLQKILNTAFGKLEMSYWLHD